MTTAATAPKETATVSRTLQRTNRRARFNQRILTWLAVGMFIFLYVPIFILIIYSFNENKVVGVWSGFSLRWYGELFNDEAIAKALWVSLWVAGWSTLVSTFLGTLAAAPGQAKALKRVPLLAYPQLGVSICCFLRAPLIKVISRP